MMTCAYRRSPLIELPSCIHPVIGTADVESGLQKVAECTTLSGGKLTTLDPHELARQIRGVRMTTAGSTGLPELVAAVARYPLFRSSSLCLPVFCGLCS
jgi:hypothetical protein